MLSLDAEFICSQEKSRYSYELILNLRKGSGRGAGEEDKEVVTTFKHHNVSF